MNPFAITFKRSHAYILKAVLSQVEPSKVEEFERKAAPLVGKAPLHEVIDMARKMADPERFDQALDLMALDEEPDVCGSCPKRSTCTKFVRGS